MGKLIVFVLGLLVGAAGIYVLFQNGTLRVGPLPVHGVPGAVAPESSRGEPERPPLPNRPRTAALPDGNAPLPPLSPPPEEVGAAVPAPVAVGPEAAAAITAAVAVENQNLLMPVQGVLATQLLDTYTQSRGEGRLHDAIDIMAARGTPVLAVADGRVAKLFDSARGGLTVYQFDGEEKLAYYYAHLDRYAPGLVEGARLKRGDPVGYVGSTGNANPAGPHLHFAVFVLGPEKRWWQGTAVNPYPLLGGR